MRRALMRLQPAARLCPSPLMLAFLSCIFPQAPPILQHFRVRVVHVIMTCTYAFVCRIVVDTGTELLDQALTFTAEWTVW